MRSVWDIDDEQVCQLTKRTFCFVPGVNDVISISGKITGICVL